MQTKNVISLLILISWGCVTLLPIIFTIVLFPIYIIATIIAILALYKTKLLDKTFLSPNQLGFLYILIPQIAIIVFWIKKGFQMDATTNVKLFMFLATEIILLMGFFIIKILSNKMKKEVN